MSNETPIPNAAKVMAAARYPEAGLCPRLGLEPARIPKNSAAMAAGIPRKGINPNQAQANAFMESSIATIRRAIESWGDGGWFIGW